MPGRVENLWSSEPLCPGELRGDPPRTYPVPLPRACEELLEGLRKLAAAGTIAQVDAEDGSERSSAWMLETTVQVAAGLESEGLGVGDILLIVSNSWHEVFPAFIGALCAGITVAIPVHTSTPDELRRCVSDCRPRLVIHDSEREAAVRQAVDAAGDLGGHAVRLVRLQESDGPGSFGELLKKGRSVSPDTYKPMRVPDPEKHPLLLLPTSGSSGRPKFVMMSDKLLCIRPGATLPMKALFSAPLAWMTGAFSVLSSCKTPMTRLFVRNPTPESLLQAIDKHKPRLLLSAGSVIGLMPQSPILSSSDPPDVSSVQLVGCAGTPLPQQHYELVEKRLGWRPFMIYGSTEAGVISGGRVPPRLGASGKLVEGVRLRIMDPETNTVVTTPNTDGEIYVKTKDMFIGYFNNEDATKECFDEEGWYKTGDVGHWDEDGYIYVVERMKEIFKCSLYHVSPLELEEVLAGHPGVKEAVVVGLPHSRDGAVPTAFVVRTSRDSVTAGQLEDLIAGSLHDAKKLRGGVLFVENIPKLPTGKVDRRLLKQITKILIGNQDFAFA